MDKMMLVIKMIIVMLLLMFMLLLMMMIMLMMMMIMLMMMMTMVIMMMMLVVVVMMIMISVLERSMICNMAFRTSFAVRSCKPVCTATSISGHQFRTSCSVLAGVGRTFQNF
ncbi:hypothetical protein DPMN_051382 [Dreissena polymorpha]|uniref:Uncharacterized protein n=1 Tax=Dreissena polymorpha TaxID=45954 RepID=A0A9D4CIG2_DREPO|nr:hypothetical protein DPMN_051382 [Dreissena polymorpha]